MCLAQGHKAVTPVRLEPVASGSRVKNSTTEPLRSPAFYFKRSMVKISKFQYISVLEVFFYLSHSADPDEMLYQPFTS